MASGAHGHPASQGVAHSSKGGGNEILIKFSQTNRWNGGHWGGSAFDIDWAPQMSGALWNMAAMTNYLYLWPNNLGFSRLSEAITGGI